MWTERKKARKEEIKQALSMNKRSSGGEVLQQVPFAIMLGMSDQNHRVTLKHRATETDVSSSGPTVSAAFCTRCCTKHCSTNASFLCRFKKYDKRPKWYDKHHSTARGAGFFNSILCYFVRTAPPQTHFLRCVVHYLASIKFLHFCTN